VVDHRLFQGSLVFIYVRDWLACIRLLVIPLYTTSRYIIGREVVYFTETYSVYFVVTPLFHLIIRYSPVVVIGVFGVGIYR